MVKWSGRQEGRDAEMGKAQINPETGSTVEV